MTQMNSINHVSIFDHVSICGEGGVRESGGPRGEREGGTAPQPPK